MQNQKIVSAILTGVSIAGVAVTSILASKATVKAVSEIRLTRDFYNENDPISKEEALSVWKHYIPTAISGVVTVGCIIASNRITAQQIAAVTGAATLLNGVYKKNKDKLKEIIGDDAFDKLKTGVKKAIVEDEAKKNDVAEPRSDETLLFYEEHFGQFFEKTMLEVQDAEYQLNRKLAIDGEATLNDFFEFLGLDRFKAADALGWSVESICTSNHPAWIDFEHELIETDDGLECRVITIVDQPSVNYA